MISIGISETIRKAVENALAGLGMSGVAGGAFVVEHPDDLSHGDYSTNAAMVFAKKSKANPRALAEKIVAVLEKNKPDEVEKIDIAGPGFVNFHLKRDFFAEQVSKILKEKKKYGSSDFFKKAGLKKVMVEYTDPNPFKEFHIGHLMSNAIGESIARVVAFSGAEVKRACYQGDVGLHVAKAIWGFLKNNKKDIGLLAIPELTAPKLGTYYALGSTAYEEDENAKKEIIEINKKIYSKNDPDINKIYKVGRDISLDYFAIIYKKLGTEFDYFFYESETGPIGKKLVEENLEKGVFEKSDGAVVFKGDEEKGLHTRVFISSEGLPTYEAKELGLVQAKIETYSYDLSIVVTGNEIRDYFKVLLDAVKKIFTEKDHKKTNIRHVPHGMLRLPTGKMSSRTGDVVTALSLIAKIQQLIKEKFEKENLDAENEKIAIGAIKYSILRQGSGDDIIFDLDKSVSFEGDSGPYLQYATVRARSIGAKAKEAKIKENGKKYPAEAHSIEKILYRFPEIVERAAQEYEPHYITTYLTELAGLFNSYYANNQIISADDEYSPYKVALTHAFETVMANGLTLLGIEVPKKM